VTGTNAAARALKAVASRAGGYPVLGAGDVEAGHAVPDQVDGERGHFVRTVVLPHRAQDLGGLDGAPGGVHPSRAVFEAVGDRIHRLPQGEPGTGAEFRRPAHLGVHDAVGCDILHVLAGDAAQRDGVLQQGDGEVESLKIRGQVAAARLLHEPTGEPARIRGGQFDSSRGGQVDDGGRSQRTVEVVVQADLGQGGDVDAVEAIGGHALSLEDAGGPAQGYRTTERRQTAIADGKPPTGIALSAVAHPQSDYSTSPSPWVRTMLTMPFTF
jgi:hypothetical protein